MLRNCLRRMNLVRSIVGRALARSAGSHRSRRGWTRRTADLGNQWFAHGRSCVGFVPDRGGVQSVRHGLSDAQTASVSEFVKADGRPAFVARRAGRGDGLS